MTRKVPHDGHTKTRTHSRRRSRGARHARRPPGTSGYRVTTASSGGGMQRALERARIDLVMLDVHFSEEDGMRLCRALRAASDVPFIILARRADEVDRILGLEMGADDYLAKAREFPRIAGAHAQYPAPRERAAAPVAHARARLFRFGGWQLDIVARELVIRRGTRRCATPNIACWRRCSRTATAWCRAASSSSSRADATPGLSIAASTCASAGCARFSATMRACRASSRQFTAKVMSLVSSLNAHEWITRRHAQELFARAPPQCWRRTCALRRGEQCKQ